MLNIAALASAYRTRQATPSATLQSLLDQIVASSLNSFISVDAEAVMRAAQAADQAYAGPAGAAGALCGIPVAVKDLIDVAGMRTTMGSEQYAQNLAAGDAEVVRRLRAQGAIIIGKANTHEFAYGPTGDRSYFGAVCNPHNPAHMTGGSSSGSAAALGGGLCAGALGTDTSASIRLPAALCGVVGMKPTYGLVSRFGLIAMASSLDQIGPFTRDVADAAELLNVIAGHDPKDSTSAPGRAPDFTAALKAEAKGLRIGLPKEYFTEGISAEVQAAVRQAAAELERAGATVEEVSLPHAEYALGAYYMIVSAESSSNLGRYDGVRYGRREAGADVPAMMTATRALLGPEVKRRIVLGTFVRGKERLPEYYMRAARVRTLLRRDFEQAFEKVDVLLTPVTPTTAFPLGRRVRSQMEAYAADICTVAVNLAGLPALSMPCGVGADGLPIGLQFIGPAFGDAQVLQAAYTYEQLAWPEGAGRAWRAGKEVDVDGH